LTLLWSNLWGETSKATLPENPTEKMCLTSRLHLLDLPVRVNSVQRFVSGLVRENEVGAVPSSAGYFQSLREGLGRR
jgi:hypothetical protein